MSLILDQHRQYLADRSRIDAFSAAINEVVKPDDVVVDLGAGTGILGLMACRAGAKRVYSIDAGGMIEVARAISRANGFEDRVVFINGLSTRVGLPEKADVVVADQIGRFGFEAGVVEYFKDAYERFLKPKGVFIPSQIDLCVAPVECPEIFGQVEFWNNSPAGFNFCPGRMIAANTGYPFKLAPGHLLGEPKVLGSYELRKARTASFSCETSVVVSRGGTLQGIGGWFSAQLSPNIVMSNSPVRENSINRRNVFFPLDPPVEVSQGDIVKIGMQILHTEILVSWKVSLFNKAGILKANFNHSTFRGMLMTREDLRKTDPKFVPKLTPWGDARRSVVTLVDGQRTLAEIEREVFARHPELFKTCNEASAFVAEVVTRYSF